MKFNPFLFFEKSNRLRAVLIAFIILCAFLFGADFFVKRYVYFEIEGMYNFYSIFTIFTTPFKEFRLHDDLRDAETSH